MTFYTQPIQRLMVRMALLYDVLVAMCNKLAKYSIPLTTFDDFTDRGKRHCFCDFEVVLCYRSTFFVNYRSEKCSPCNQVDLKKAINISWSLYLSLSCGRESINGFGDTRKGSSLVNMGIQRVGEVSLVIIACLLPSVHASSSHTKRNVLATSSLLLGSQ